MKTVTWRPGTNKDLDQIFDAYRIEQYEDKNHKLSKNYSTEFYKFSIALTIAFNDNDEPEICSSIASRDCWPKGAYRILSRLWKTKNYRIKHSKFISEAMVGNARSQIQWLKNNTDCELYFISRETGNWMKWTAEHFDSQYGLKFIIAPNKYLTCPNECDNSCWQHIIYNGNKNILKTWKQR